MRAALTAIAVIMVFVLVMWGEHEACKSLVLKSIVIGHAFVSGQACENSDVALKP